MDATVVLPAMPIPDVLRALLTAPAPSGREGTAARVWRDAASAFATDVRGDVLGSSVAIVDGTASAPLLAIVGHIDEIGLIVNHIDDDGMLWFGPVGGWDPQILVGQRVEVQTDAGPIPGVVGKKPIHLLRDEERKKVAELRDLHIDIGTKDGDDARTQTRIGDVAVIAGEPVELPNGRVVSRALDNRLGAYVALETARVVAEAGGAPGTVAGVASAQEETSGAGAQTTAFALEPGVAIAVDVCHATDAPGVEAKDAGGRHGLGDGAVISRGGAMHPRISELLEETARAEGIPYTVEAVARGTYTDADSIFNTRGGVATGLVSIPLRYMHSPVELVQLSDVEAVVKLLAAFAHRLSDDTDLIR
jgi:putative aminopeptidase FrvX